MISVSGKPWEIMQKTLTSWLTPLSNGSEINFVLNSGRLEIFCWTLPDITIPPSAANVSIRDATFTSSPSASPSLSVISPSWIPIRRFKSSTAFDSC